MTREEKIAKAREMRAEGKTSGQIALVVGAPASTVRGWYLGGNCEECEAPVNGGNGADSSRLCSACAPAANRKWTPERLIAKVREWVDLYGAPPAGADWNPWLPYASSEQRSRFSEGDWPTSSAVLYHFRSWNELIKATGFSTLEPGHHRHQRRQEQVAA